MSHDVKNSDYGTGEKTLSIYIIGFIVCIALTLIPYWTVIYAGSNKMAVYEVVFIAAIAQFIVQVICFLRLNAQTKQSKMNLLSFIFSLVLIGILVAGSLWIMCNLNYNMH